MDTLAVMLVGLLVDEKKTESRPHSVRKTCEFGSQSDIFGSLHYQAFLKAEMSGGSQLSNQGTRLSFSAENMRSSWQSQADSSQVLRAEQYRIHQ